jgi:hypothetical protein
MTIDSRKPKECVGITRGPSYKFTTIGVLVLLLKGPTQLPCLLCSVLVSFCLVLSAQPCLALNNSTISSVVHAVNVVSKVRY